MQFVLTKVSQQFSERRRQITIIWQSLPILSKVLILIRWTIMIPFIFALSFSILLTLVFVIPAFILYVRWGCILNTGHISTDDMKVPTSYSATPDINELAYLFFMSVVGVV